MTYNNYFRIKPEATNILGGGQRIPAQPPNALTVEEPTREQTLWGKFKSKAKEVLDKFKEAVVFIKDNIAPILTATASILGAWGNFRRGTENRRDAICAA